MDKVNPMASAKTSKELGNRPNTVDWYSSSTKANKRPRKRLKKIGLWVLFTTLFINKWPNIRYSNTCKNLSDLNKYNSGTDAPGIDEPKMISKEKMMTKTL